MAKTRRYALVTGAASGLGRAICERLAEDGWHVAIADIDEAGARETLQLVQRAGGSGQVERLDVRDEAAWRDLVTRLRSAWPQLDMLVNNAGVCATGRIEDLSIETWDWMQAINLRGLMLGCVTCLPWLKENPNWSYVMNMASVAGVVSAPHMGAYGAFKAAVVTLSETMWMELRREKISVTAVCPWFVQTRLLENGRFTQDSEKAYAESQIAWSTVTPRRVAKEGVRATLRGKSVHVVGRRAYALYWIVSLFGSVARHVFSWAYFNFHTSLSQKQPPTGAAVPESNGAVPGAPPHEARVVAE